MSAPLYPQTVAGAQQWLRDLNTHPPEWWEVVDNQFHLVQRAIQYYGGLLSPIMRDPLIRQFSEKTKTPLPRVRAIFDLARMTDVRRALSCPTPPPVERIEEGTDLYPTEGWIAEYLHYSQGSEIPMGWHFWFAVGLIGAACRRNVYAEMGSWQVFPYWYFMLIEQTASKKSTGFGIATDILARMNSQLLNEGRIDRVVYEAAPSGTLAAFLDDIKTDQIANPNNSAQLIQRESCAVLPVDELVTLIGKSAHNPEEWIGFLTAIYGWTKPEWVRRNVAAGTRKLYMPAISFWAGSTVEWIQRSVTEDMFAGGFLGRFVFIKRKGDVRDVYLAPILDPVRAEHLAEYLGRLAKLDLTEFRIDAEADRLHEKWYSENKKIINRFENDKFQAYWGRKQSHLIRLMMCLCIAEGRFIAGASDFERARGILEREELAMEEIFSSMGSHPDKGMCDYLLGIINKELKPISYSDLLRRVRHKTGSAARTRDLLHTLVSTDELKVTSGPRGGAMYEVNRNSDRVKRRLENEREPEVEEPGC